MSILQAPNVLVIQLKVVYSWNNAVFLMFLHTWYFAYCIVSNGQRFEGIFGGKIDKAIDFEEVLVLSSYMCKASQVCFENMADNPVYNIIRLYLSKALIPAKLGYVHVSLFLGSHACMNENNMKSFRAFYKFFFFKYLLLFFRLCSFMLSLSLMIF